MEPQVETLQENSDNDDDSNTSTISNRVLIMAQQGQAHAQGQEHAGGAPPAPVAGVAAAAPPQPVFALTPALVDNAPINYQDPQGIKLFKTAVAELPLKFDGDSKSLRIWLAKVHERAVMSNWVGTLTVADDNNVDHYLPTEYGQVSLDNVQNHARTYIGQPVRDAQNSQQIYQCLAASLTESAQTKVYVNQAWFNIDGTLDGPCLLKTIISVTHTDTHSTVMHIRMRLSNLDQYMISVDSKVDVFNRYVKTQRDELSARGETTNDLLMNLFKGYDAASDQAFRSYISKKKDSYEEDGDLVENTLMDLAENKYHALVEAGKWNAPTKEQEQILALSAEVKALQRSKTPAKAAPPKKKNLKGDRSNSNSPQAKPNKKKKGKTSPAIERDAWKLEKPLSPTQTTRKHNGKTYHWCPYHQKWTLHKPEECRLKPGLAKKGDPDDDQNEEVKVSKALAAIADSSGNFHDE